MMKIQAFSWSNRFCIYLMFSALIPALPVRTAFAEGGGDWDGQTASVLIKEAEEIAVQADRFPLKNGLSWKYNTNLGEAVSWVKLTGNECVIYSESPSLDMEQRLSVSETGVLLNSSRSKILFITTERVYQPPLLRLPLPLRVGRKWVWEGKELVAGDAIQSKVEGEVQGEETIKVPAGQFKCLKVKVQTTSDDGTTSSSTQWLASGVGVVKAEIAVEAGGFSGFLISLLGMDKFTLELKEMRSP